jgi:3'-phosphoadenosine 5'-phosphosulfate sulfotransferase (PAPS reductase)/FAD synthetase
VLKVNCLNELEFILYAKQSAFQQKLSHLIAVLSSGLDETCFVSFSAGKDSSILAHACHSIMPGIPILMVDPGCPTAWTEKEKSLWLEYAFKSEWNMVLFPWDKWKVNRGEYDIKKYQANIHDDMFHDLNYYAEAHGLTTRISGIREEESRGRKISIRNYGIRYKLASGVERWYPISRWTTQDVWAYIVSNHIPYLDIYRVQGPSARSGLIGRNGAANGRIVYLRKYFPEAYREAKKLLPMEDILCQ